MLKIKLALCGLLIGLTTLTGCATWWSNFKKDPVAQTQTFIRSIDTILSIATVVFGEVKPQLPPAVQPTAQVKFDAAVLAVHRSVDAIQSTVQTAADAQQDKPNLTKLIADATKAVQDVQAVIDSYKALAASSQTGAGHGTQPSAGYSELTKQVAGLKRYEPAE